MKIFFGTTFDNGYYLDYSLPENRHLFNVKICGPQGLLEVLERMTGNSGNYPGSMERKLAYVDILEKQFDQHKTIYNDSFSNDPVGVAGELLRYRDQLIMAGWGKDAGDISVKINTLREIEKESQVPPGPPDRFRKVLECIREADRSIDISRIDIHEERDDLHPFFNTLFDALASRGIEVFYHSLPENNKDDSPLSILKDLILGGRKQVNLEPGLKEHFQLIRFNNDIEASHFFAEQHPFGPDTVVIQHESSMFISVLGSYGHPVPGSVQRNANTGIIQLFKMSASLFTTPLNIYNYMAYLQAPEHPVSRSLRFGFLDWIASNGGTDEHAFNDILNDYKFNSSKDRERQKLFLLPAKNEEKELDADEIGKFYNTLASWANTRLFADDETDDNIRKQLGHLKQLCDLLVMALRNHAGATINQEKFLNLINDVYEPVNIQLTGAEIGSVNMVNAPEQLISETGQTIWLDFYNHTIIPGWYDFLSAAESRALDPEGSLLWGTDKQAAAVLNGCKRAVLKSKGKLCLVVAEKSGDSATSEHPFHSFLKARINNIEAFTVIYSRQSDQQIAGWKAPKMQEAKKLSLPSKKPVHNINNGHLIQSRVTESYSSTELLINHPFDWTFQYPLMIKPGYSYELGEIETTLGNVAHRFIQKLLNDCDNEPSVILERLESSYETDLRAAVTGYGSILLLPENSFEYTRLKQRLADSVRTLLEIIQLNQLTIIGSEQEFTHALAGQGNQQYTGDVDLLLETGEGKKVIIDLKWTRKASRYSDKLQNEKAVQLALYHELVASATGSPVEKTGYYLLFQGWLFSVYPFKDHRAFRRINTESDDAIVAEKVYNSIRYRRQQLTDGIVEDGEQQLKDDILYSSDAEYEARVGLEFDNGKKQKINYYSRFRVFKGNHS